MQLTKYLKLLKRYVNILLLILLLVSQAGMAQDVVKINHYFSNIASAQDDKERIVMVVAFTFFDLIFLVLGWFFGIVCQNYGLLKYWPLGNFLITMNHPGLLTYNRERDRMPIVPISSNV